MAFSSSGDAEFVGLGLLKRSVMKKFEGVGWNFKRIDGSFSLRRGQACAWMIARFLISETSREILLYLIKLMSMSEN